MEKLVKEELIDCLAAESCFHNNSIYLLPSANQHERWESQNLPMICFAPTVRGCSYSGSTEHVLTHGNGAVSAATSIAPLVDKVFWNKGHFSLE